MPTYELVCTDCARRVEVLARIGEDLPSTCPGCGGRLRRVFSPVGIIFKGSGFHRTDYGQPRRFREEKRTEGKGDGPSPPGEREKAGSGEKGSEGAA